MNINKQNIKRLRQALKTVIIALYSGAALCAGLTLRVQGEFVNIGSYTLKNSVTLTGQDAVSSINLYWTIVLLLILMAVILHIILKMTGPADVLSDEWPEFVICPKCEMPLKGKDNLTMICPSCQSPLEDLTGFHERQALRKSFYEDSPPQ